MIPRIHRLFARAGIFPALVLGLVGSTVSAHGPGASNDFGGCRVLLIGVDGTRADALRKVVTQGRAPHLRELIAGGTVTWNAYTGGEPETESLQNTVSGPGWTTVLTGTWRDQHGVADNRFRLHRIAQAPHWMRRLKDACPSAWASSLCDWEPIQKFIVGGSRKGDADFLSFDFLATPDPALKGRDYPQRDREVLARAVEHLAVANPDAMFVYFGTVDEVGHAVVDPAGSFSPDNEPYLKALETVDGQVGELLKAMRARPQFAEEHWLVLLTTDHGGRLKNHGAQTPEERTIWIIAHGGDFPRGLELPGPVPQTAIAPTVFRHLGVGVDAEWGWSKPFGSQR
jgi:hypothetical protein